MKYLCVLLCVSGCASFNPDLSQHLRTVNDASNSMIQTVIPTLNAVCSGLVTKCEIENDAECPEQAKCDAVRTDFVNLMVALKQAILDAETALAADDMEAYQSAINRGKNLILQARRLMQGIGAL